jgi:predicted GH43/DUF377 family glycosyl hydrolase
VPDPRKASATFIVILLLCLTGLSYIVIPKAQAASQGCLDVQATPVLQDSNWHMYNSNYSDFATKYVDSSVFKSGGAFILYVRADFNNSGNGIFRGTSADGKSWKLSPIPVLSPGPKGSWDELLVFSPDVVWNGTGYMMYYVGDGVTNRTTYPANFRQIGAAFSPDGIHWTKSANNPVIAHGPGTYDARYTRGPSVVFDHGTYRMWYTGATALNSSTSYFNAIDYATSPDGVHWTKFQGNPVFTGYDYKLNGANFTQAYWPSVIKVNGSYVMAFSDGYANIGLATSQDGTSWKFNNQSTPLLTLSGWHNGFIGNPSLMLDGQRLLLWYTGTDNSSQKTPYVAGVGMAGCGILVVPQALTTTSWVTSVYVVTVPQISTSISTSIQTATHQITVVSNPSAPLYQVATAGVVGGAVAFAVAAAVVAIQLRRARRSKLA